MLKMLGAACVVFSASAVGFGFSGNVRRQCAQLTALMEALTYLKSEMLYRRTPLPQALGMLAERSSDAAIGGLFAIAAEKLEESCTLSVHAAFRTALGAADRLALSTQVQQTLLSLSLSLGQLDMDGQERALELASERLSAQLRLLEQGRSARCRSYTTIGICAGMALAVILL